MITNILFLSLLTFVNLQCVISALEFSDVKYDHIQQDADPGKPLILTPYLERGEIEEARNLSRVPGEYFLGVESYTGFFTVNKTHDSNTFFWFVPATNVDYKKAPVLLWLQGGPGYNSLFALFNENGPFQMINGSLALREATAWTLDHSVIYIDNPVGTGYSFTNGRYCTTQEEIGEDLYTALIQFFQLFPELQKNEFFATGESYAGKYLPTIAYTIHKKNRDADIKINLQGVTIGDGCCDPINQLGYGEFLYQVGLVDDYNKQNFIHYEQKYADLILKEQYADAYEVFDNIFVGSRYPPLLLNTTGFTNYFNILEPDLVLNDDYSNFIQSSVIRKAIHVGNSTFDTQNSVVLEYLKPDWVKSVAPWISELLSHYRMMFYNGQLDLIAATPLTDNFLRKLNFSSAAEFKTAERKQWMVNEEIGGYVKIAGNLTEVMVRNAGHMVPGDQPFLALEIIKRFIKNAWQ